MFNVTEKLNIQVPLFVNTGVQTEKRTWEDVDAKTGETIEHSFLAYGLNGVLLTDEYGPSTYKRLNVAIDGQGRHGFVNPIDVANTFMENMQDLISGKKYILADVALVPRGNKSGNGINALYPNLKGLQVVDSDTDTVGFITKYLGQGSESAGAIASEDDID